MRHRHLLAVLLASSFSVPVLAQEVEATVAVETQTQAAVVQTAATDQEDRRDRRGGEGNGAGWRGRDAGNEGMRGAVERVERMPQEPQSAEPEPRRDWVRQRVEGGSNEGGSEDRQRRETPVMSAPVMAAPAAPAVENRGWRGDWQRRVDEVRGTPPTPPVIRQDPVQANGNWRGGDRDRDGRPNWRDRDRDGDGIRNNRDWDRNNNGRVDGRWDGNNNGVVDRRYDWHRNGVRDNRGNDNRRWNNNQGWNNGGHWNNDRNWSNNRDWNHGWRNDRRYDWQTYRYSNRNTFRLPRYSSPYGYGYRYQQFGIGFYLESVLFGSRYRISDPGRYRLPQADWPYQWVRYYDDVLLVDTRDGYIVDVINNFFW